jgi:hypothetical protein
MKQDHTEQAVKHTDTQQNTGNHTADDTTGKVPGGTRAGAGNVEPPKTNIERGTDVDKVAGLEEGLEDQVSVNGPTERTAERDERGRI